MFKPTVSIKLAEIKEWIYKQSGTVTLESYFKINAGRQDQELLSELIGITKPVNINVVGMAEDERLQSALQRITEKDK